MSSYVVDASVAAGWLLADEPLIAQASLVRDAYMRGEIQLEAPDLLFPEVGNVLWKAVRRGRISEKSAHEGAEALIEMEMAVAPTGPLLVDALSFASVTGRSAYDNIYVALAIRSKTPLLTADERLANALGARFPVQWLGLFE